MKLSIITRNFGWKAGSLLLAVLLWVAFTTEPDIITEHTVPVLYRGLSPQYLVGMALVAAVGAMLFSVYPAWRASRLRPVQALAGG